MKVLCPKCHCDQITANKKGFSGGQAVAGALSTGGIGVLDDTHGSDDIIITCLACGNTFKPGEGKVVNEAGEALTPGFATIKDYDPSALSDLETATSLVITEKGMLFAIKFVKDRQNIGLKEAKAYVDDLAQRRQLKPATDTSPGCGGTSIFVLGLLVFIGYLLI